MDLFVVNRYEGDDVSKEDATSSEANHLDKLLSKIRAKKEEAQANQKILAKTNKKKPAKKQSKTNIVDKKVAVPKTEHAKQFKGESDKTSKKSEVKHVTTLDPEAHEEAAQQKRKRKINDEGVDEGQFTVIGTDKLGAKRAKVESVLPYWIANPSVVSADLQTLNVTVDDIPQLSKQLVNKLKKEGISHFFPVQHQVIPCLLAYHQNPPQFWPRDVCVSAPTGSGKTLAFVLPIIQALQHRVVPRIRALVILPVQELASQVHKVFQDYIDGTNLRVALINGKDSYQQEQSLLVRYFEADSEYHTLVDIVVATPGRLVDHLQGTKGFSLQHLKYLVIDEADRVMSNFQNDWLYHLQKHISSDGVNERGAPPLTVGALTMSRPPPQKLLFSATLSQDPEKLQRLGLFQPRLFTSVGKENASGVHGGRTEDIVEKYLITPAELIEHWVLCEPANKPLCLYQLILNGNWSRVLVFTNSVKGAHRLAVLLRHLLGESQTVSELSSGLIPKERKAIFKLFAEKKINVLVCSDALARGIDVPDIDYVVSYDAPRFIQNYIHRNGRTGRAGRKGTAITLVEPKQRTRFESMLGQAGKQGKVGELKVELSELESLQEHYRNALNALRQSVEEEDKEKKNILKSKKKHHANVKTETGVQRKKPFKKMRK